MHHDNVGYIALADTKFEYTTAKQSGRWSDIGAGTDETFRSRCSISGSTTAVPKNASYEYLVLPGPYAEQTEDRAKISV